MGSPFLRESGAWGLVVWQGCVEGQSGHESGWDAAKEGGGGAEGWGPLLGAILSGEEVGGKECSWVLVIFRTRGTRVCLSRDWSLGCPMEQTMLCGMGWRGCGGICAAICL